MRAHRTVVIVNAIVFVALTMTACEQKTTMNFVTTDGTGQCWSEWYNVPISKTQSSETAHQYIEEQEIEPFDVTWVPC